MRFIVAILAWTLAAMPVVAQQNVRAPATPLASDRRAMPEDALPENERLSFLEGYVEGNSPLRERRWALNRALQLAARKDSATLLAWQAREAAFYRREAARIDVFALPPASAACDVRPDAGSVLPVCSERSINYDIGNLYEIAAEAAHLDGDRTREFALREAAAIFMGGAAPHFTYWINLATRAADAGEDETARRVCSYLRATQYRVAGPNPLVRETNCQAYAAFKARRWSDWLGLRANAFATTSTHSLEALLRYCVAFARTGASTEGREACGRASDAVSVHSNQLAEAAARPDSATLAMQVTAGANGQNDDIIQQIGNEVALRESRARSQVSMAVVVADLWASERVRVDSAISACKRTVETGSIDEACAVPENLRTLNVTFVSRDALISELARLGRSTSSSRDGPRPSQGDH